MSEFSATSIFPPGYVRTLTHVTHIATANEARIGDGVALYYNPQETLGPDHITLALGRVAGLMVARRKTARIGEPGVGSGGFSVSAVLNSSTCRLEFDGDDNSPEALLTTAYNLSELSARRPATFSASLRCQDWDSTLVLPGTSANTSRYDIIYWNPPYKTHGDYVGMGEGTTAPGAAIYSRRNNQGFPDVYAKYLPGLYRLLAPGGVAFVRLPEEAISGMPGFYEHIAEVQQAAYSELGLRYTPILIEVPQKNPATWGENPGAENPDKWIPYRTGLGMVVARDLPTFFGEQLEAQRTGADRSKEPPVIYQDIQYRLTALASAATNALITPLST